MGGEVSGGLGRERLTIVEGGIYSMNRNEHLNINLASFRPDNFFSKYFDTKFILRSKLKKF